MRKRALRALTVAVVLGAASARAEEAVRIPRGTDGLAEVTFTADNMGPGQIDCSAALAHWYSAELGRAPAGSSVRASLWFDSKDGSLFLLNALGDRMPVQALWCGLADRAWATRTLVEVERLAGSVPRAIHIACAPQGERLLCR